MSFLLRYRFPRLKYINVEYPLKVQFNSIILIRIKDLCKITSTITTTNPFNKNITCRIVKHLIVYVREFFIYIDDTL